MILWASYQIRKIAGCACAGNVFPARLQRKPLVSDPGLHHVTHVPWCMPGSLTLGAGENVPGIPATCATRNLTYLHSVKRPITVIIRRVAPAAIFRTNMSTWIVAPRNDHQVSCPITYCWNLHPTRLQNMNDLKDYISYAKTMVHPKISEKAGQAFIDAYVENRKIGSGRGQVSAYPRQLESLIRLAEAHAKMRLSDSVELEDVEEARRSVQQWRKHVP